MDDGKDRTWEGDMFPVKRTDTLARWQKMILWETETQPGGRPPRHEIVTISQLEVGDMVEWFDAPLEDGYEERHIGLVVQGPRSNGERASVLMRRVSYTAWFNCPVDKAMFIRLVDRSGVNDDPYYR